MSRGQQAAVVLALVLAAALLADLGLLGYVLWSLAGGL